MTGPRVSAGQGELAARGPESGYRPHRRAGSAVTALVVDDEAPAKDELVYLLHTMPAIDRVDSAGNSNDALKLLQARRYDVAFLDVRMPFLDGIELARVLRRFAAPPAIVFVTAYEQYAVGAFEVRASDYLLKPVSRSRVAASLDRALQDAHGRPGPAPAEDSLSSVPIETRGRIRLIDRAQVCWVEAAGDYTRLHLADGSAHLLRMPISHLEERWSAHGFIRIHRGHLVQVEQITEFAAISGNHTVSVAGKVLPVSRRHAHEVRDRFLHAARKG
jgi:DNA-binding LytR/AlgR family response regulator